MLLELAIQNNVGLYESVLGPHGIAGEQTDDCWWTPDRVPPYYANLVSLEREAAPAIAKRLEAIDPGGPVGVKDSFACLDLAPLGFRPLFDACWYTHEGGDLGAPETSSAFARVDGAGALARFEAAWQQSSPAPGQRIFRDALLDDPRIEIWSTDDGGGAILNRSPGAIGISNVFPSDPALHRDVARLAARRHPDRAIVGYGQHEDLLPLGFRTAGPLRVWIREAD